MAKQRLNEIIESTTDSRTYKIAVRLQLPKFPKPSSGREPRERPQRPPRDSGR